ncbi:hypothetical protein [Streptomyces sp. NPDC050534]|uniref:hypothetical protein n=1 Tax=Streptomyces sp. NPDC050534 TaxID=3365625 RepID=UPI00378B4A21
MASSVNLLDQCRVLDLALGEDAPLKAVDWARTLLATEIVFVSDLAGILSVRKPHADGEGVTAPSWPAPFEEGTPKQFDLVLRQEFARPHQVLWQQLAPPV